MKRALFSFITFLFAIQLMATNLVVERTSGADILQDIATIGKWVFVGDDLQLIDKSGNILAVEAITNVRKITFSAYTTNVEDVHSSNTIVVFPNPTHDILYVKGADVQTLRVYDMQGRIVQMQEGTQISVANLPEGTYLLQIGTQVLRFIKQ